jgi:hypothetical protein
MSRTRRQIEVAPGNKPLICANDRKLGLTSGQVISVSRIAPDCALQTKEGQSLPADFRQWCHGYVVTSHKAQGWTADHVVIAAERHAVGSAVFERHLSNPEVKMLGMGAGKTLRAVIDETAETNLPQLKSLSITGSRGTPYQQRVLAKCPIRSNVASQGRSKGRHRLDLEFCKMFGPAPLVASIHIAAFPRGKNRQVRQHLRLLLDVLIARLLGLQWTRSPSVRKSRSRTRQARITESLPQANRRAVSDVLSEIRPKIGPMKPTLSRSGCDFFFLLSFFRLVFSAFSTITSH